VTQPVKKHPPQPRSPKKNPPPPAHARPRAPSPPGPAAGYVLVATPARRVADDDFRDDRVDGGEVGPGHTVTALYAVRLKHGAGGHLATATVRWLDPATRAPHEESGQLETDSLARSVWSASPRFQVTATAAYFADALRKGDDRWSPLPGAPSLGELRRRSARLASATEDADVRQLGESIAAAARLDG
ncbi:YfbK domain-containing protein, partial [Streptomyces sp. NPDC059378]|uniref:YfbK domain-containing protein n=1 Tax=Streptomyces sp. NPDC059378 TaxID=3346815 RepID=UPI0036BEBDA2